MVQFLLKRLLKQISFCVPQFLLILIAEFHSLYVKDKVPTHYQKSFSIVFQYLFNTKLKFNTITSLHFPNFLIIKLNFAHPITVHKYWSALPSIKICSDASDFFSILFQYLMYILAKFNTFSRSWKTILKFNTFSILRGNPVRSGSRKFWKVRDGSHKFWKVTVQYFTSDSTTLMHTHKVQSAV